MATYAWLDDAWYAAQKVEQMKVLDPDFQPSGDNLADFNAALAAYNAENGTNFDIGDNFKVCNESGYLSTIPQSAINVSPNKFFDVTYYLQSKANAMNAADATANATPQTVLKAMYDGGYSAWAHYVEMADGVDPSALFSTAKYLEAKAAALTAQGTATTAAEVKADLQAKGYNAIMDFMENGAALNITEEMVRPDADKVIPSGSIAMKPSEVWVNGSAPAPEGDPYDDIQATKYIGNEADQDADGKYVGADGVNTDFVSDHLANASQGEHPLGANDVIVGGAGGALNTLTVTLGSDWAGFNGVAGENWTDPLTPNVTHVGRIRIDRQEGVGSNSERNLTFNAKNISDDAVQYDLNASGTGATHLTNLGSNVERINIRNLASQDVADTTTGDNIGTTETTKLSWASPTAHTGKNDELTIGLENTGGKGAAQVTGIDNIETIIVDSIAGTNGIDLTASTGIKHVQVEGAGDVQVKAAASGIKDFDAHTATGNVNFALNGLINQAVTGGEGNDTVTFMDKTGSVNVKASKWSGIEDVAFSNGANVTLDAAGTTGLKQFWVGTAKSTQNTVENLDASDVIVYATKAGKEGQLRLDGKYSNSSKTNTLNNVTWHSSGDQEDGTAFASTFTSNASGKATVEMGGLDTFDSTNESKYVFQRASSVSIISPNDSGDAMVRLEADAATSLDIQLLGGLVLKNSNDTTDSRNPQAADLGKVQNLTVKVTDNSDDGTPDTFDMSDFNLGSAQQVNVDAGGEDIVLGNLGSATGKNANPMLNINVQDAHDFTVGILEAGLGGNVNMLVNAEGDVAFGNVKTTTNSGGNDQGDVEIRVVTEGKVVGIGASSTSSPAPGVTVIEGGALNIDFDGVYGTVGSASKGITLKAAESIFYRGAQDADTITIAGVGAGNQGSVINPGEGQDNVTIEAWGYGAAGKGKTARLTLNLDDGDRDSITITNGTYTGADKGFTVLTLNTDSGENLVVDGSFLATSDDDFAAAALKAAGLGSIDLSGITPDTDGWFAVGDTKYLVKTFASDSATVDDAFIVVWNEASA